MPTDATGGVPWSTIVAAAGSILGALAVVIFFLTRMLLKSYRKSVDKQFETLVSDVHNLEERLGKYFEAHERLRDKWDEFLREYLKIDSTRGQKVDALFRIVDQMQETLRDIRPSLNAKVEEMISHALSELKLYVRDLMREERDALRER